MLSRLPVATVRTSAILLSRLTRAGVVRPHSPVALAKAGLGLRAFGAGFASGIAANAALRGNSTFIIDDRGELTWREAHQRTKRLASGLRGLGVRSGDRVALLCRNNRYFVEASAALGMLGADVVYLNTGFSAAQREGACEREGVSVLIADEEFLSDAPADLVEVTAWQDQPESQRTELTGRQCVEDLIRQGAADGLPTPPEPSRPVILTSGTTGAPKGARRHVSATDGALALLTMPLRSGQRTHIAAPLFHTWGWAHSQLALLLGSTLVLHNKFDPQRALTTMAEQRCDALVAVPVMLRQMLDAPRPERVDDLHLRVVAASGSALPGDLATEWMDAFGDNLYNTYGSTEAAWATIATPDDLRKAPGTAGKPPPNTVVAILDDDLQPVPTGERGSIYVANAMLFEGYTDDAAPTLHEGMLATGDRGHLDGEGRLFVDGRSDDMVVCGGENVYPQEIQECLMAHPAVHEAAVVGMPDETYGTRLRAFVALSPGESADEDQLRDWVRQRMANFQVPREVRFLGELPRNTTGKVLLRELRGMD